VGEGEREETWGTPIIQEKIEKLCESRGIQKEIFGGTKCFKAWIQTPVPQGGSKIIPPNKGNEMGWKVKNFGEAGCRV